MAEEKTLHDIVWPVSQGCGAGTKKFQMVDPEPETWVLVQQT